MKFLVHDDVSRLTTAPGVRRGFAVHFQPRMRSRVTSPASILVASTEFIGRTPLFLMTQKGETMVHVFSLALVKSQDQFDDPAVVKRVCNEVIHPSNHAISKKVGGSSRLTPETAQNFAIL